MENEIVMQGAAWGHLHDSYCALACAESNDPQKHALGL
jgi:hypothetical protein